MGVGILAQPVLERAGVALHGPLDDRPVDFLDGAFAELFAEPGRRLAGAGEQEDAGHWLVEPMHDAEEDLAGLLVLVLEIFLDGAVEGDLLPLEVSASDAARL